MSFFQVKDEVPENKIQNASPGDSINLKTLNLPEVGLVSGADQITKPVSATIMNVQSVCPNVKTMIITANRNDKIDFNPNSKTILVVNKDGGKMTFSVATKPVTSLAISSSNMDDAKGIVTTAASSVAGKRLLILRFSLSDHLVKLYRYRQMKRFSSK